MGDAFGTQWVRDRDDNKYLVMHKSALNSNEFVKLCFWGHLGLRFVEVAITIFHREFCLLQSAGDSPFLWDQHSDSLSQHRKEVSRCYQAEQTMAAFGGTGA